MCNMAIYFENFGVDFDKYSSNWDTIFRKSPKEIDDAVIEDEAFKLVEERNKNVINLLIYTNMSKLTIKPLADRVIVEPAAAEEKTAFGIIIPDTAKEKPQKGIVVAIGNGKKDEPITVKVGDEVLYGKYSGTEITIEGKDYLIMRESDIFAVL